MTRYKWFNEEGFGFIEVAGEKKISVHFSKMIQNFKEGDKVEFEVEDGARGPQAANMCSLIRKVRKL